MSSEDAALVRLLARSSRAELRGLSREGVLAEGVAGLDDSLSTSALQHEPKLNRFDGRSSHRAPSLSWVQRLPVMPSGAKFSVLFLPFTGH